ncbi:mediator of RNA polymerase II transcription subunit 15-like isoform X2 [Polyodon spathula]|uniref:mediator of RNA polymerase II transcription subunit 15-like isoform X2 n=1 Tax=Polyodon spathula TaxID=7913 RepID=UPI001B7E9D9C|nr:mediator of RNA polymerase II transcription subunit 15-like isoform X2 [Polyodon spathula]
MDPGAESDWRSLAFRQKVVGQIEEAMRKAGTAHNKSSNDMENHVFMKAKSREEYLSLVARLIIHFRDILETLHLSFSDKKAQGQGDPMNALQNLTGGPSSGAAGMGMVRPQGVGMTGLGQISQQMLSGQAQPGASGMPPHGLQGVANAAQQNQLQMQQLAQQQQHQQQFQQQQAALQQQQQQQQFQAQQQSAMQQQQFQAQQQQIQQQHILKLQQMQQQQQQQQQQQNQQQQMLPPRLQQQHQQLQQLAQLQQLQQQQQAQAQAMQQQQVQQPMQQPQQQQQQPQSIQQQMQQMAQQQQAPQPQQAQLPPQSQQQTMVPQPQSLAGQIQGQPGQTGGLTQQQQQQLKAMQARAQMVQQQQQQQQQQAQQAAQQQAQHQAQQVAQAQLAAGGAPGQMMSPNMLRGGMQIQPRLPRAAAASAVSQNSAPLGGQQMPQVSQSSITMMSSPSPVQQVSTPQSMPPPSQPQPSPQPPTSQPNSVSSGPAPSPGGFLPSPSPQPSQSPATARTPQNFSVPSPGPLNTPGNPGSVMSPASSSQTEEQQYLEKLKQLSKYIEPLRRMINKIDKNEDRKKDLSKMKSLLDILTDPSKRCPLKTLQKCEIALEKLKNDMAVPTPPPPPVPSTKQQYLCQPLLDAVLTNMRSPVFNHSLYRTFAPAMTAIHGPPIVGPIISARKRKHEDDERQTIPNILQGEVARLNPKFLVNLDPSHCSNNGTVHLICKLDDKNLPSVPPLQLSIPADYPEQSPQWSDDAQHYEANPFLQTVHRNMTSKLLQLPDKHSVTALLSTWAQSVRQACLSAA